MKTRGFTLIELLIALVIIGILITIAIPKYNTFVAKTRKAEAIRVTHAIADAAWMYYVEKGSFPSELSSYNILPPELNVGLTQNPTKYYRYYYTEDLAKGLRSGVILVAVSAAPALPYYIDGHTDTYTVFYMYDTPTVTSLPYIGQIDTLYGQKLDAHWYKYYVDSFELAVSPGGP